MMRVVGYPPEKANNIFQNLEFLHNTAESRGINQNSTAYKKNLNHAQ